MLSLILLGLTTSAEGPCDILGAAGNPCVAAHSTTRALYGKYAGPLYKVQRPDNSSTNITLLKPGGFADIALHEQFCAAGDCVIANIFDQSPNGNHLAQRISDGVVHKMVNASLHKISVAGGVKVKREKNIERSFLFILYIFSQLHSSSIKHPALLTAHAIALDNRFTADVRQFRCTAQSIIYISINLKYRCL